MHAISPITGAQLLPIRNALDRILANDVISPINVPAHDNSAMDGYAFCSKDIHSQTTFTVVGTALAGQPYQHTLEEGQAVRIMTGAMLPAPCDTVLPQELASISTDATTPTSITLHLQVNSIRAGQHRRLCGEDLAQGHIAIPAGKRLGPAELGLLASLGLAEVRVQRRLRVAIFSTGDELRSLGQALEQGCVYDSNRYTLYGMLTRLDIDVIDLGVVADNPQALEQALITASQEADAVITSGGVSVGLADYTKQVMAKLGDIAFWSIAMRPGRPFAFGQLTHNGKSTPLFGLPGNPVAVMVSFLFFVRSALLKLAGAPSVRLPMLTAITTTPIPKKHGRTEFQRGIYTTNQQGQLEVASTGHQGSGVLSSMSQANCMIVIDADQGTVAYGDTVKILLLEGLI